MVDTLSPDIADAILACRLERASGRYSEAGLFLVGLDPVEAADGYSLAIEHGINQIKQGYVGNAVGILKSQHQIVSETRNEELSPGQALLVLLFRYTRLKTGEIPLDTLEICDSIWSRHLQSIQLKEYTYTLMYWHLTVSIFLRSSTQSTLGCGNDETKERLTTLAFHLCQENRHDEAVEVLLVQRALWGTTSIRLPLSSLQDAALGYVQLLMGDPEEAAMTFANSDHAHGSLDVKSQILKRNMIHQDVDPTIVEAFGLIDGYKRIDYAAGVMRVLRLLLTFYRNRGLMVASEIEQLVVFWERRTGAAIMLLADPLIGLEKYRASYSNIAQTPRPAAVPPPVPSLNVSMQSLSLQTGWRAPPNMSQPVHALIGPQAATQWNQAPSLPRPVSVQELSALENPSHSQQAFTSTQQTSPSLAPHSTPISRSSGSRGSRSEQIQERQTSPSTAATPPLPLIFDAASIKSSASDDSLYAPPTQKINSRTSQLSLQAETPQNPAHAESSTNLPLSNWTSTESFSTLQPTVTQAERRQWFDNLFQALPPLENPKSSKDKKSYGIRSLLPGSGSKEGSSAHQKKPSQGDQAKGFRRLTGLAPSKKKAESTMTLSMDDQGRFDPMKLFIYAEESRIKAMTEHFAGAPFEKTALSLSLVSLYKAVASWFLEGPLVIVHNVDEALNWLQCADATASEGFAETLHELRALATILARYGDGLNCFAAELTQQDLSDLDILRKEALARAYDRMDATVHGSYVILATIDTMLGSEHEARQWLGQVKEAAAFLDRTHLIDKTIMASAAVRAEIVLKIQESRFSAACELLDAVERVTLISLLESFELKQQGGGSTPREVELKASAYYLLGHTLLESLLRNGYDQKALYEARSYFEKGMELLKTFNLRERRHAYLNCLSGLYQTFIREGSASNDCEALKQGFLNLHGLACVMEDLRVGLRVTHNGNERQHTSEMELWKRTTKDAFTALLLGLNISLELQSLENWNYFAMSTWTWVQLVKARELSNDLGLKTYFFELHDDASSNGSRQLLTTERHLVQTMESSPILHSMQARQELRQLRKVLELDPSFSMDHTAFNGQAQLSEMLSDPALQNVFYVDYFTDGAGNLLYSVMGITAPSTPSSQPNYNVRVGTTGMTMNDVGRWCGRHLNKKTLANSVAAANALDELHPLVSGLEPFTERGRLIVLCPAGQLCRIPLHAIKVNAGQTLIERNSVVYTATLHSFIHCVRSRNQPVSRLELARLSAWIASTRGEIQTPRTPRSPITRKSRSFSFTATSPPSRAEVQNNVHHSIDGKAFVQLSGSIVQKADRASAPIEIPSQLSEEGVLLSQDVVTSWKLPTSPLVFAVPYHHNEAEDMIQSMDPAALPTSLLLAGARSVVGSLWPTPERDADRFLSRYNKHMREFSQAEVPVLDLAYLMQRTVVEMMQEKERDAPCYWASFVLYGSWRLSFQARG